MLSWGSQKSPITHLGKHGKICRTTFSGVIHQHRHHWGRHLAEPTCAASPLGSVAGHRLDHLFGGERDETWRRELKGDWWFTMVKWHTFHRFNMV